MHRPRYNIKHIKTLAAVQHLVQLGAIGLADQVGTGVYSHLFTVPKKSGDIRVILNLKWLNRFIQKQKFKMETLKSILLAIRRRDFLVSLDLTGCLPACSDPSCPQTFPDVLLPGSSFPIQGVAVRAFICTKSVYEDSNHHHSGTQDQGPGGLALLGRCSIAIENSGGNFLPSGPDSPILGMPWIPGEQGEEPSNSDTISESSGCPD